MATTEFYVRRAGPADREMIVEFNCRLAEESEGFRLEPETVRSGVEAVLADHPSDGPGGKGRYFVACLGERVVGQMMHTWEWSDWRNGEIWWLQSVYVVPEFRRRGVFRMLYEHAAREAESDPQVVGLRLYVEHRNASARETYRKLGMREAGYVVLERMKNADTFSSPAGT